MVPEAQRSAEDTVYDNWHCVIFDVLGTQGFHQGHECWSSSRWNFRLCDGQEKPQGQRSRQRTRDVARKMLNVGGKNDVFVVDTMVWVSNRNFDDWSTEAQGLSLTAAGVRKKGRPPAACSLGCAEEFLILTFPGDLTSISREGLHMSIMSPLIIHCFVSSYTKYSKSSLNTWTRPVFRRTIIFELVWPSIT